MQEEMDARQRHIAIHRPACTASKRYAQIYAMERIMEESNKFKPPAYQTALGGSTTLIRPILLARIGASDLGQHRKARRTPDSKDDMAHCKYADASEGCRVIETLEHAYTCRGRTAKKKALTDAIAEFVGQIQINREKHVNRTEPGEYPTGNDQDDRKIRERKERIQRETLEIAQLIPPELWCMARSKPECTNMPATRRTTIQSMADAVAYPNAISESAEKLRRCTSSAGKRGMDSVPPDGLEILAQTWIQAYSV